jgi:TPR repeat protein
LGVIYVGQINAPFAADSVKSMYYFGLGAMKGDVNARLKLGLLEEDAGNDQRAIKHFLIGAKSGHQKCLDMVRESFMIGRLTGEAIVTKDEYEDDLRSFQQRTDEMKSEARDEARCMIDSWGKST